MGFAGNTRHPAEEEPMRKRGGMISGIGGAIDSALKAHEIDAALLPHKSLTLWPEVAGVYSANHSIAVKVKAGVLFVCTSSSDWSNELTLQKKQLLKALNDRLGRPVISDIHCYVTGWRKLERERRQKAAHSPPPGPTESDLEAVPLNEPLPALSQDLDSRLREILERAARTREWKRAQGWRACARCQALFPPEEATTAHAAASSGLCPLCALL